MITASPSFSHARRLAVAATLLFAGLGICSAQTAPTSSLTPPDLSAGREMRPSDSATDGVIALEAMQVTGTALRSQEAVNNRRESLGVVDTLTMDDTGDLADENLADALIRLPGVSTMQTLYGEQEASYVSTRGISPDLNFVSFDGIAMFSTASDGDGLRRVDLNLIPTQISRTTSVFKSFTADLDAGAIGGVTNIEPYSALNGREIGHITGQLVQQTGTSKYVPGVNSRGRYQDEPLGGGLKGLWVKRFGSDGRFGVVLSGVYRQRNYDYTKRNPNGRVFYTSAGTPAAANLSNWDGLHPFPTLIRPMDYTHYTETFGGFGPVRISNLRHLGSVAVGFRLQADRGSKSQSVLCRNLHRPDPPESRRGPLQDRPHPSRLQL